jgi:metallo-beta-lactamase family protein
MVSVRAKIETVDSFSGHADHSELIDWFQRTTGPKHRTWLVHGEPDSAQKLREGLMAVHTGSVEIAELGGEVEF